MQSPSTLRGNALLIVLLATLIGGTIALRPLMPVDETRYLSVAWEMWDTGDFLVPHINGLPYSHKPPLLFWLIHLVWTAVGVHGSAARLVAPAAGVLALLLGMRLADKLWKDNGQARRVLPFVLLAMPLWAVLGSMTMFDMLLALFSTLAALGYLAALEGQLYGWALVALAFGGGLLAKGPAIFIHTLPLGLLMPWWAQGSQKQGLGRWYLGLLGALLAGAVLALCWALPAAKAGGQEYANAILWGQTVNRVTHSMAHGRPVWWYLPFLPLFLFPWGLLPGFWRSISPAGGGLNNAGVRFCIAWGLPIFVVFSFISGKQIHYLLPMLMPLALLASRALTMGQSEEDRKLWRQAARAMGALCLILAASMAAMPYIPMDSHDLGSINWLGPSYLWGLGFAAMAGFFLLCRPQSPWWASKCAATATVAIVLMLHIGFFGGMRPRYDLRTVSAKISQLRAQGAELAVWPVKYEGQFQFLGRLHKGHIEEFERYELAMYWAVEHPEGYMVVVSDHAADPIKGKHPLHQQQLGGLMLGLWRAADLAPETFVRH